MTNLPDIQDIAKQLKETRHVIADAQIQLSHGKIVNLESLNKQVSAICDSAVQLEPIEAKKLLPPIADMVDELEKLATGLESFKAEMKAKVE